MRMPNAERALVPREKILEYLLSPAHRVGASKCAFFMAHGFTREGWEALADALRRHAMSHDATPEDTPFGTRHRIDGPLDAPDGRRPACRVVWFLERDETTPRLVTAYPLSRSGAR